MRLFLIRMVSHAQELEFFLNFMDFVESLALLSKDFTLLLIHAEIVSVLQCEQFFNSSAHLGLVSCNHYIISVGYELALDGKLLSVGLLAISSSS